MDADQFTLGGGSERMFQCELFVQDIGDSGFLKLEQFSYPQQLRSCEMMAMAPLLHDLGHPPPATTTQIALDDHVGLGFRARLWNCASRQ